MAKKLIFCLCLFIGGAAATAYADVLYCHPKMATGFLKKDGNWNRVKFDADRFTLKVSDDLRSVQKSGTKALFTCSQPFGGEGKFKDVITCSDIQRGGFLIMLNTKTLRYYEASPAAFSWVTDGNDSASIEVGTCEKF